MIPASNDQSNEAFAHAVRRGLRSAATVVVVGWTAMLTGLALSVNVDQAMCVDGPQNLPNIGGFLITLIWGAAAYRFWSELQNRNVESHSVVSGLTSVAIPGPDRQSRHTRPSLRYPVVVFALTLPLSLQLLYLRPEVYMMSGWIISSAILTTHVHVFFAHYCWKDVQALIANGSAHDAQRRAWKTSISVAAWAALPGILLFGLPSVVTLFTALFITVPLYAGVVQFRDVLR